MKLKKQILNLASRIGLAESWAFFMEDTIGKYYKYFSNIDDFNPFTIPSFGKHYSGWMPSGLYYDLLDNNADKIDLKDNIPQIIKSGYDNFNGKSYNICLYNLYETITKDGCNSVADFKTKFTNKYPSYTNQINALFSLYCY